MKTRIDEELDKLDLGTMSLSTLVEEALGIITSSLNNSYGKDRIKEIAQEIEEKSKSLEASCINLLLKFHPVARDLKRISSTLCAIRDLSRIGDNSLDFCEMLDYLSSPDICKEIGLLDMALEVKKMLSEAISSFMSKDVEKAKRVEAYDDVVDKCFSDARKKLCTVIRNGVEGYEEAVDVVIGAKYLERMGDHAASIAHAVVEECGTVEDIKGER
ncbi:MAG: phosphate signaling complex PhoU family protein [Candidatus Ornithospirochaeta sp.]